MVLSISGSDPSGGAGIEADLKTFHRHGIYGMAIPTLLTAQNTLGVRGVCFLDPDFLAEQWRTLLTDLRPSAIKIGALGSKRMVLQVVKLLSSPAAAGIPVVLDPIMGSTSGAGLLESNAFPVLASRLIPLCRLITPNAPEFSALCGMNIKSDTAVASLRAFGRDKPYAILLKGGHFSGSESLDLLWDQGHVTRLRGVRLPGDIHGTGCVLASSVAANLALGCSLLTACRRAKSFLHKAIATAPRLGNGRPPLNLWA
jgi:hydroxymethylpyrimidine/phosphomethylpyrimidine kinase